MTQRKKAKRAMPVESLIEESPALQENLDAPIEKPATEEKPVLKKGFIVPMIEVENISGKSVTIKGMSYLTGKATPVFKTLESLGDKTKVPLDIRPHLKFFINQMLIKVT